MGDCTCGRCLRPGLTNEDYLAYVQAIIDRSDVTVLST